MCNKRFLEESSLFFKNVLQNIEFVDHNILLCHVYFENQGAGSRFLWEYLLPG